MKIITSTLFLTFMGALYVKCTNGRVPVGVRYVKVRFTDYTLYHGFLSLVWPQNKRLDAPHSLRPLWMTFENAHHPFDHYSIYMEMSYYRRYTSEALQQLYRCPSYRPDRALPEFADVYFADHQYSGTHFVQYNVSCTHPSIADDDEGGRIYITIENTLFVYYSIIRYMGVSMANVPNLPRLPAGYFH